jgi:hypothetical protein
VRYFWPRRVRELGWIRRGPPELAVAHPHPDGDLSDSNIRAAGWRVLCVQSSGRPSFPPGLLAVSDWCFGECGALTCSFAETGIIRVSLPARQGPPLACVASPAMGMTHRGFLRPAFLIDSMTRSRASCDRHVKAPGPPATPGPIDDRSPRHLGCCGRRAAAVPVGVLLAEADD